jgi:hypothetical protein
MKKLFMFLPIMFTANLAFGYISTDVPNGCMIYNNKMYPVFTLNPFMPVGEVYECNADFGDMHPVFEINTYNCSAGYYLPANAIACVICPVDSYCGGGAYTFNETVPQGIVSCGAGLFAPSGMSSLTQCGRILHIGDNVVYLHSVKKTTPALHVDIDQDGTADYFGNMTTLDVPMTNGTERKLKLQYDGVTYSVYDDSVDLSEYEN